MKFEETHMQVSCKGPNFQLVYYQWQDFIWREGSLTANNLASG